MQLKIISPEKIIYSGEAELITLPGELGLFTILDRHAPIISALKQGTLTYRTGGKDTEIALESGFVEAKENVVSVCIE
ncbi:MAG: ATP synthase F1 subunit epsilon [Dysgonamonadaceae bacterium]|jgi:F-type H+-transporting ATPase subunit epsilon|nr:ATP synthase F1 subunit epsilon [Dysgonamonadaceae bacterium]